MTTISRTQKTMIYDFFEEKMFEKENQEFEMAEDPLVLACVIKSIHDQNGGFRSLDDPSLLELTTGQHRAKAEAIRKYFTRKFFWNNLKGRNGLSPFRQRTLFLLESKTKKIKEQDKGLYFKLPFFYEEDQVYEKFKKELKVQDDLSQERAFYTEQLRSFEYLETTIGWQGKEKVARFWFKDRDQYLYSFTVLDKNPLKVFFAEWIARKKDHLFICRVSMSRIDDLHHYTIIDPKPTKE